MTVTIIDILGEVVPATLQCSPFNGVKEHYTAKTGPWLLDRIEELPEAGLVYEGVPVHIKGTDRHGDEYYAYPAEYCLPALRTAREAQRQKDAAVARVGRPIEFWTGHGGMKCFRFGSEVLAPAALEQLPDEEFTDGHQLIWFVFEAEEMGYFTAPNGAEFKARLRTWKAEHALDAKYPGLRSSIKELLSLGLTTCGVGETGLSSYLGDRGRPGNPYPDDGYAAKRLWVERAEAAIATAKQRINTWGDAQVAAGKMVAITFAWGEHPTTRRRQLEARGNGVKYVVDDRQTRIYADAGTPYYCSLGRVLVDKPNFRLVLVTPRLEMLG